MTYYILVRPRNSKRWTAALPVRKGVTKSKIRILMRQLAKRGQVTKLINRNTLVTLMKRMRAQQQQRRTTKRYKRYRRVRRRR